MRAFHSEIARLTCVHLSGRIAGKLQAAPPKKAGAAASVAQIMEVLDGRKEHNVQLRSEEYKIHTEIKP